MKGKVREIERDKKKDGEREITEEWQYKRQRMSEKNITKTQTQREIETKEKIDNSIRASDKIVLKEISSESSKEKEKLEREREV